MTNTTHIMLDLETWGKRPGCDIRSIGAVVFDPVAGIINVPLGGWKNSDPDSKLFYIATDNPYTGEDDQRYCDSCGTEWYGGPTYKYPLHRDPETVKWWNDQSPEAHAAFTNPVDLWKACYEFRYWIWRNSQPTERFENWEPGENVTVWANGPQFDVSILAEVYHAVGLPVPWHYRAPRDFRTITDAAGMTREEFSNYGDAHNALHDAIAQAMTVCEAYKRLGLRR